MHVSDIVDAHIKAVDLQLSPSVKCINLCTGQPYSILNVISTAETVWNMPIKFTFQKRRKGDAEKLFGNYELANDLLGWKPSNSKLEQILKDYALGEVGSMSLRGCILSGLVGLMETLQWC